MEVLPTRPSPRRTILKLLALLRSPIVSFSSACPMCVCALATEMASTQDMIRVG